MEQRPFCTCGLLDKQVRDPDVPITFDETSGKYFLRLSTEQSVEIITCGFCGGYGMTKDPQGRLSFIRGGVECRCGRLAEWTSDPSLSVQYDKQMNEWSMPGVGLFYYCVACGGRLPESKRTTFFTEPLKEESREFFQRTEGLKTIEEVISVLGKPDGESGPITHPQMKKDVYDFKDIRRQITYTRIWKTLTAVVQELEDGTLQRSCSGKLLERGDSRVL